METVVERGQEWKNKKLGTVYEILALGICCDEVNNNKQSIIYTQRGHVFTRCVDEFLQKFERVVA